MKLRDLLAKIEERAPRSAAESWDNVGLLVGDDSADIHRVLVSIDLTRETLEKAKSLGAQLIINHHPCIFPKQRGLARVTAPSLVFDAARSGIHIVGLHTNFDRCALEVVDAIAQGLGVEPRGRLHDPGEESDLLQLTVFVPQSHLEAVRLALCGAGAGEVGKYDQCSFAAPGEGTYRAGAGAQPFLGAVGVLERAQEARLEVVVPRVLRSQVTRALVQSHPYEEVAHTWVEIQNSVPTHGLVRGLGYGFWGEYKQPIAWEEWCSRVGHTFDCSSAWGATQHPKQVKRVAFSPGKGTDFLSAVMSLKCDAFVTGEVGYHAVLGASARGTGVIELGHTQSEKFFGLTVLAWLKEWGLQASQLTTHGQSRIAF